MANNECGYRGHYEEMPDPAPVRAVTFHHVAKSVTLNAVPPQVVEQAPAKKRLIHRFLALFSRGD